MQDTVFTDEIPMGFGMALAQNLPAMQKFSSLPKSQQQQLIDRTQGIRSRSEMRAFVDTI